jgi:hypothetical protein
MRSIEVDRGSRPVATGHVRPMPDPPPILAISPRQEVEMRIPITLTFALLLMLGSLAAQAPEPVPASSSRPDPADTTLSSELVPVGAVILWWGDANALPDGYELCDGTLPVTKNAVLRIRKPDLRDRFVKGPSDGAAYRPETAQSGGRNQGAANTTGRHVLTANEIPAHTHPIPHTHDAPAHTHPLAQHDHPIGGHTHVIGTWATVDFQSGNQQVTTLTQGGQDSSQPPSGGTTGAGGAGATQSGGGGPTGPATPAQSGSNATAAAGHSHDLPGGDNRPAFLEMLFLIRVR